MAKKQIEVIDMGGQKTVAKKASVITTTKRTFAIVSVIWLAFVYTLACLKQNKNSNSYNVFPTQEIHTFKSKTSANVYYETVSQIVEVHANDKAKRILLETNEKIIESFLENTK